MACAMIKPADQSWSLKRNQQRRKFSSDAIQKRRKFSSDANSAATQTSSSPRKIQIPRREARFLNRKLHHEKFEEMSHACKADFTLFLAKVLRKLRRSPGDLLPDFSPCTVTNPACARLRKVSCNRLLPKLRTKISDFVLSDFTRKLEGRKKNTQQKLFSKFSPSPPLPPPAAVALRCDCPGEEVLLAKYSLGF
ncbi:hypothetical protein F511_35324 [Dorcoceras hygrometricum]|uniref:Uncharacterized protein n=1 Tax=Dorcoceras hygrometricum TaxID=472368 RepID=A0A2Z7BWW0_9LAMI|nr:hypothetical protein F511_35324 [Dorcoceras hygrometricum]